MNQKELLIAGIVSTILYIFAIEYLIEVPILGFFLAWVGWLVPVAFFYGVWEEGNKK